MSVSIFRSIAFAAAAIALVSMTGPAVNAQTQRGYKDPLAPKVSPTDRRVNKFLNRGVPETRTDRAARRLFDDPMRKLGLPENRLNDPNASTGGSPTEPKFDPGVARLDADRDGSISRAEYFRGRSRLVSPGRNATQRSRSQQRRLESRFRRADTNGDGLVSPAELKARGGPRF